MAEQTKKVPSPALLKAVVLFVFIVACVCLFHFTPAKGLITPQALDNFLEVSGLWAPLVFILIHAVSICLFLPASILSVLGATIFGTCWGFLYVWIGAMAGASGSFFIGRTLGRDFVASLTGDRLSKYENAIERNGFSTVFYLRLMNLPFTPLNFGMGLTKIRFKDYFFGTAFGAIAGIFILTFFGGTLKEVWRSGNWTQLISFKIFLLVALVVFLFFVPLIIKKINRK